VTRLKIKTTDDVAKAVECACCVSVPVPFSLFLENKSGSGGAELGYNKLFKGHFDQSTYFATATRDDSSNGCEYNCVKSSATWPEVIMSPYPSEVYSTHGSLSGPYDAYQPWSILSNPVTPDILKSRAISAWQSSIKQWASYHELYNEFASDYGYSYEEFIDEWGSGQAQLTTLGHSCRIEVTGSTPGGVTHIGSHGANIYGAEEYRLSFTSPPTNYLKVWIGTRTTESGQQPSAGYCYTGHLETISESFSETSIILAEPSTYKKKSEVQYSNTYPFGQSLIGAVYNGSYSAYQKSTTVFITRYSFVEGYEPDISDPENKQPNGFPDPNWEPSPP
jgi:hypothetical protein